MRSHTLVVVGLLGGVALTAAVASPPNPNPIAVDQPGGPPVTVYLKGSKDGSWYVDEAGFPVTKGDGGEWRYAIPDGGELHATTLVVGDADPRFAGLLPSHRPEDQERQDPAPGETTQDSRRIGVLSAVDAAAGVYEVDGYTVLASDGGLHFAVLDARGRLASSGIRVGEVPPPETGLRPGIRARAGNETADPRPPADEPAGGGEGKSKKWWDRG